MKTACDASKKTINNDQCFNNEGSSSTYQREHKAVISLHLLDIEEYASLYTGRNKIVRLLFMGERCPNLSMQLEALKMAYDEIKKGVDTKLFREVVHKIDGRLGSDYGLDLSWIEAVERETELSKERIEKEIKIYLENVWRDGLNNLLWGKERLRIAYTDYGDFHYARGALGDAFEDYEWSEEYCTNAKQYIDLYLNLILVSIDMGNFTDVLRYVDDVTQSKFILPNRITLVKLQYAAGLAHLELKQFKQAAKKCKAFVEAPEFVDSYSEVIASPDVAKYGGLCALATFNRAELKANVIDNMKFNKYLDLVPEVREVIHDFYSSRYASCLDILANLKPYLLLDIHLHDHVELLYTGIRNKALIQYTLPYVSLDMNLMASTFKTNVTDLQKELETLIRETQIQAKIDSVNKVLYACPANERNSAFRQVLQTGSELVHGARAMLQRFNLTKRKFDRRA